MTKKERFFFLVLKSVKDIRHLTTLYYSNTCMKFQEEISKIDHHFLDNNGMDEKPQRLQKTYNTYTRNSCESTWRLCTGKIKLTPSKKRKPLKTWTYSACTTRIKYQGDATTEMIFRNQSSTCTNINECTCTAHILWKTTTKQLW